MIGKLTGTLLEKNPPEVLVDCGGVGYEVQVPMSTFYNLPAQEAAARRGRDRGHQAGAEGAGQVSGA
jgi:Holliday junction resolvasome RuvABC DNA-binding subunit